MENVQLPPLRWYVLQATAGFEQRVLQRLKDQIRLKDMQEYFGKMLVPAEDIIEMRAGQKHQTSRKFFPGYILVQMSLNESSWHFVRTIPKVIGFVGGKAGQPVPISDKEADSILARLASSASNPRPKFTFEPGEMVRVTGGPFTDFHGVVEEVDYGKSRVKVLVSILGRSTPIELEFGHVEKA